MKKLILITLLLLITGCTTKVELDGEITEIKYNDTIILEDEYQNIKDMLNTSFSGKASDNLKDTLIIKTKSHLYAYKLSDNYISYDGKIAENNKLNKYLTKLENTYTNKNFFDIKYIKNYNVSDNDLNINLDKTSNYIIIKANKPIKDFKINAIDYENKNNYQDVDLLYEKDKIANQTIVIRKSIDYEKPDIRISFSNQYNYNVSIIPIYNGENLTFNKKYKTKNSN